MSHLSLTATRLGPQCILCGYNSTPLHSYMCDWPPVSGPSPFSLSEDSLAWQVSLVNHQQARAWVTPWFFHFKSLVLALKEEEWERPEWLRVGGEHPSRLRGQHLPWAGNTAGNMLGSCEPGLLAIWRAASSTVSV